MVDAYAYLRVSGAGQIDGHGFDRQLDTINNFSKKHGYQVLKIFREQSPGANDETNRPLFSDMVSQLLSNHISTVIVESLDRFAREYRIQEHLLVYLASKEIDLLSANTGENVTAAISADPMRKAVVQIQGIFAELDKSLTVNKLKKAREKIKKEKGKCEGAKKYGKLPGEAKILNKIRYMRRKKRYQKKAMTYKTIAEKLNMEGIKTRYGRSWNPQLVFNVLKRR